MAEFIVIPSRRIYKVNYLLLHRANLLIVTSTAYQGTN